MADYIYTMESRLSPGQLNGVHLVQRVARKLGGNLYLTGGAIRDILTGFPIRDLDFTVEGDPFRYLKDLEAAGVKLNSRDEHLRALHLILPGNVRAEISMARVETHEKAGKAPVIADSSITEDLRRRDFTVNAIALSLNEGSLGLLLDPANGSADIEAQQLRILHNYAFLDDPSRLIRATRFSTRFGWEMEEKTAARYAAAKENSYIDYLRRDAIGYELEQLAHEADPIAVLNALDQEGWLKVLYSRLSLAKADTTAMQSLLERRNSMWSNLIAVDGAPSVITFLTRKLPQTDVDAIRKLLPHKEFISAWKGIDGISKELAKKLSGKEATLPSQTWKILTEADPEAVLYLAVTSKQQAVTERIDNFLGKWREVLENMPQAEFTESRITPQLDNFTEISTKVFLELIDGKLQSHEEILEFLALYSPPLPLPSLASRRRVKPDHSKKHFAPHVTEESVEAGKAEEAIDAEKKSAERVASASKSAAMKEAQRQQKLASMKPLATTEIEVPIVKTVKRPANAKAAKPVVKALETKSIPVSSKSRPQSGSKPTAAVEKAKLATTKKVVAVAKAAEKSSAKTLPPKNVGKSAAKPVAKKSGGMSKSAKVPEKRKKH